MENAMKCPFCGSIMVGGKVTVEKSGFGEAMDVLDAITGGMTSQPHYIYFRESGGEAASHVDHSGEALRCGQCRALLIRGRR